MTVGQISALRILLCITLGVVMVQAELPLTVYMLIVALFIGYGLLCQESGVHFERIRTEEREKEKINA